MSIEANGEWKAAHAGRLEAETPNPDHNTAYLNFRMHVAPRGPGGQFRRSSETVEAFRVTLRSYHWSRVVLGRRDGGDFNLSSGSDGNVWVRSNGTLEFQQLYHDQKTNPPTRLPVSLPELFADIYGGLLAAEEAYTTFAGYRGDLYIGVSVVNIFDRDLSLPSDIQTFFDGEPRRASVGDVPRWTYHGEMTIGEDPLRVTRRILADLFWVMGYDHYETYLARWGKVKERPDSRVPSADETVGSTSPPDSGIDLRLLPARWPADAAEDQGAAESQSYLATVLFTDIVDSSGHISRLGDTMWIRLLESHDAAVRGTVMNHGGAIVKHTGDGFLATFSTPTAAVVAACEAVDAVSALGVGLQIRAGVHIGECEVTPGEVFGHAVHVANRVMSKAGASEVTVSRTVRDVTMGLSVSRGIAYSPGETHELHGVGSWEISKARLVTPTLGGSEAMRGVSERGEA